MLEQIQKVHCKELFDLFEQDDASLDIILCSDLYSLSEVQSLLETENLFTLVSLEQDDLRSQRSILEGLHGVFFDDASHEMEQPLEFIEAIEDELGELQTCVLIVEDFSSCVAEIKAALLELVIVSRTFKLLLKVEENFKFSENENLWSVLALRSGLVDNKKPEVEVPLVSPVSEKNGTETSLRERKLPWYQLVPKYHFVGAVFLFIVVLALWNMDVSQKKEQIIDLNKEQTADAAPGFTDQKPELGAELKQTELSESANESKPAPALEPGSEPEILAIEEKEPLEQSEVMVAEEPAVVRELLVVEEPRVVDEPVVKASSVVVKPVISKVDWRPFQSEAWINGLNSKYFTLQLMASHDAQGIRNFLLERGVSSQYAVYSTEKSGKPWHVIIYGVYEKREFANLARQDLPDYLKSYSPWVRTIKDVQSSIK